ncbi:uncharacterized protein B0H64DRAFT_455915 [Chaetomium fimeti]|uniref:Carrier domain-containing protein n=1 Tax=Chaetomium fimeti TaxID=1854472 RepID=A0AAE0LT57_9PEZI|nr:hypothetical protein B0H64DRAFT_455915 [Chaetomium fimeti]
MEDTAPKLRPPITQLRPLHSLQQPLNQELAVPRLGVQGYLQDGVQLLHWSSPLELKPDRDTVIKAFVKLVARLVILEPGEAYCIQDAERGGFILARSAGPVPEDGDKDEEGVVGFIEHLDRHDIPTDFSIGEGKALQLHVDAATRQVRLTAQANAVPTAALEALGQMLDDLILGLQQGRSEATRWTQPSVLNFPPKQRPLALFPREPICSDSQRDEESGSDGDGPALLHRWFEQRVAETPDRTAVDFLSDLESGKRIQYTYQNVENAANALAAELVRTCAQPQSRSQQSVKAVGVLMGPCPELYTSYLAVLKAGMAFCPIPVDAPRERQEALIADLRPAALLVATSSQRDSQLSSPQSTLTATINVAPYLAACDTRAERQPVRSSLTIAETDTAYILYTSGTTGMPKGVAISHISAACTISALSAHYRLVPPTSSSSKPIRWYQGAAPTFDISLFEIFWTLSTGSTLCCAPRECTLQDIDKVVRVMEADMTNITPSFASLLDPSSIRALMVGGETLNTRLLQDFARYNPTANHGDLGHKPSGIYNGYGPTETAIYCIAQAHVPAAQRGSVLGTPLATCGCLIVDERVQSQAQTANLEPVPMGAVGELVIIGPQVSRAGYLNRSDETAAAFLDDAEWGRAYKTGDRARVVWGPRGEPMVEFLGRMSDDQVKLSGRRVELGEIESVLASRVDGVRETMSCVWKSQTSETGSERVVSLVVPETHAGLEFELAHKRCLEIAQRYLPDYMRPFKILQVDALPRTVSGKLDRKAASAYVQEALKDNSLGGRLEAVPHKTFEHVERLFDPEDAKLEEELTDIVSGILSDGNSSITTATVTATTPLAQAGMDSLRAMRLLRDIRKRWPNSGSTDYQPRHARLQPSLALLLDSEATIRSVFFPSARYVDVSAKLGAKKADTQRQLANFSSRYVPEVLDKLNLVDAADIEMVLPTTCTQSQLAVSFAIDRRNYISHSVLKLRPDVSAERLKEAVERVVSEQAIYRCAILPCDDSLSPFAQVILAPEAWRRFTNNSSRVVHRRSNASQLAGDVKPWLELAEKSISLDLQTLYHIQIIEPDSDSGPASVKTGLLAISMAHCICDGASLEVLMSDVARQYAGLEPVQRQGIYDVVFEWASNVEPETDQLWRESLKAWETESFGSLSGDNTNPSAADTNLRHGMVEYASDLPWQVLEGKSRVLGASPLSILQASWSLLLSLFSESDTGDIVFGSIISGYHLPAHAPTFSVVPCRVVLPEAQTISELVGSLATQSRFAQSHQHTSFGIFKTRPYNTALALQAYPPVDSTPEETVPMLWTEIQNPAICYDFSVFVEAFPTNPHSPNRNGQVENMAFKLTYREDALSELSATFIVKQLAALIEIMWLPARTIPAPAEITQQNDRQSQGRFELLHSQFEDQAALTPELLALSFYSSLDSPPIELSYAELDARANGLANTLRKEDVEVIPICLQRSVELYVAILAILKAGSAWCPIDETSPSKVLLTTTDLEGVRKSSVRASPRDGVLSSHHLSGQDLAYLLWTSGTTGEPKGAMRDLQIQVEHDEKAGQVRTLQLSAYSFDVFVQDLFYTWGIAGSVVSGTRELVLGTFVEFIWKSSPTHAHLTPSFGASIHYVTFIGEKLTENVAEAWAAPEITTRAYNTYGPAENAVVDRAKAANVGFPLAHCTAYVVREVELVPRYGIGELALGGAQAFIQGVAGIDERIYLTGDFLGRNDDLVKITGIRIELSEISAACASVKDDHAAVEHVETLHLPRPGAVTDSSNKVVVTFVSVKKAGVDAGMIRGQVFQKARDLLPMYMVPGHVVVLDTTMPRTASNKSSDLNQSAGDGHQTKLQWTEDQFSMATEPLSPGDSLAGLGFSSLQVTKLAWSLKRRLRCAVGLVEVVLRKLPRQKTELSLLNGTASSEPAAGTTWLVSIKNALTKTVRGDMRPHDTLYVVPATPIQESLVAETMLEPRAHLGTIDGHRLKYVWTEAARKFDILRTIFVPLTQLDVEHTEEHGGSVAWARQQGIRSTILQLVRGEPTVRWAWLSGDEDQDLARWAEKLQMELAPTTTIQPPWSVTFNERNSKVMLSMHHALYDSVSSEMLLNTVAKLYQRQGWDDDDDDGAVPLARGMELGLLPTTLERDEAASLWDSRLSGARETVGALNAPFPDLTQSRQKQPQRILLARKPIPPIFFPSASAHKSPDFPTLFQSAFGCVLASYLELKAVVLGQTVSQRILHPDLARVMGPAMATLPVILWSNMTRDSSSLSRTMHNLHPVDIKKILNHGSESSNAPFPGFFVYHPAPESVNDAESNTAQQMFRGTEQALSLNVEHPLALNVFELEGAMELTGDGSRISQAQLELMLDQIIDQARAMLEMDRNLISISGAASTEMVSLHASEHPDWIAVEELALEQSDEDDCDEITTKTITYAQLNKLANAIASSLASHQVHLQPDDVSFAATLAIFRAGYVYLPVDEDLPPARKQLLIRDAKAKLIITTEELARDLDMNLDSDPPALLIPNGDDDIDVMLSWPVCLQRRPESGDGGYLLYTSGSTGRPKGVRVTRIIESSPGTAVLGGTGKYLNLTSRAFDPHLTQLFVPWHLGYRVVIGRDRTAMLGSLQRVINQLGITHFGSVPSVLTQLGLRPEEMPSVRVVTTGGEKASSELLNTWTKTRDPVGQENQQQGRHDAGAVLFNFYGPTEVTIGCLGHAVNAHSNARNLGLPFRGLEALLLCPGTGDEQVVARRGQPGELCIAGPQVSMGYLDRPIENAKSFQTTLLLGGGHMRMYRTGDMMRMMHDGTLEFLGRADQQTKIRGQRLELDEVVHFLKEAAAGEGDLDFAAVVVSNDDGKSNQQQQLFGFVAPRAGNSPKAAINDEVELLQDQDEAWVTLLERIDQKCETGLPAFMVPTMLSVSNIPYLAASGKVDTKLLAKIANDFFAAQKGQEVGVDPASTTGQGHVLDAEESAVVMAVQEAMGSQIHLAAATSSIHRLGIDSLSAVPLVSLLRRRGFSRVSMADILSSSCTVRSIARLADRYMDNSASTNSASASTWPHQQMTDMAREVEAFSASDLGSLPVHLSESEIEAVLPCLPLQSALVARSLSWWLRTKSAGDGNEALVDVPYVAQFHYHLARGTDVGRWKMAAEAVIASEATLRTCFVQREHDGQIFQVVLRSPPSPFNSEENTAGIVAQMSIRSPIRLQIQETDESGRTLISLKIHHALFDGAAIDMLRKRFEQAYDGQDPLDASYNKSLGVLTNISGHCYLSGAPLESTRRLWQARLNGVRRCRVGAENDNSNNDGTMVRSTRRLAYTATQLKDRLRAPLQQSDVPISVSTAFQLATALCLAQLTRQRSVVYGFVMSLRPLLAHVVDGTEGFIGPCLNTLVQTLSFRGVDEGLPELAQRVHGDHADTCRGTSPFATVEQVQRWAGSEERLFDSLLSINIIPADEMKNGGEPEPGRMTALRTQSKSDMALAIDVDLHADGRIDLALSSAGSLTESQLDDVGRLFEEVVYNSADKNARVARFLPVQHWDASKDSVVLNGHQATVDPEPELGLKDEGFQEALACVQTAASRLLRLKPSDIPDNGKTTSLYQLGLDSITIIPFVKLINKLENIWLAPDAVIKARTIQGTAKLVQEIKTRNSTNAKGNARKHSRARDDKADNDMNDEDVYDKTLQRLAKDLMFAATPLQESMLSASLAIADKAYTYVHTTRLSQDALAADTPNLDKFFAAVRDTVQACEILRTRFIFTQDDEAPWVGVVSPTEQSDLVNWEVVKSDSPGRVRLRIHHALYDATSIQEVWRILGENYSKRLRDHDNIGSREVVQHHLFRPFARTVALAQRASVAFWTALVQEYSYTPLELPGNSLQASPAFHFVLSEQELSLLQARCRSLSVTTKAALQLAWVKVLCESVYGQGDVVYGEVISTNSGSSAGAGVTGDAVVGPTINTVPMRVKLADQGIAISAAEALGRVQELSDEARGAVAMGSLRKIQALWRSSSRDGENMPPTLFQSLFVFDGVIASASAEDDGSTPSLFRTTRTDTQSREEESDGGPAYDDTPVIVSFQIKNNALHGKLRAKMSEKEVETLGSRLEAALRWVLACEVSDPALSISQMNMVGKRHLAVKRAAGERVHHSERDGPNPIADAVLELAKTVLGTRQRGRDIGYNTRLVNVGLDSILAIRLSMLLRKQMGIAVSVFEITRGASIHDIVKNATSTRGIAVQEPRHKLLAEGEEVKDLVANKLGLPKSEVKSIVPVLPGQRAHLEQWLHSGKRFFEPPWVYRVVDGSLDTQKVANAWAELCRVHGALRTTFVWAGKATGVVQVTLGEQWAGKGRFSALQDQSKPIQTLIDEHVEEGNTRSSDLRIPPASFSFLDALDGQAVVLRVHHALYDAWSIKMVVKDLNELLAFGKVQEPRALLEDVVQQIRDFRQPDAEDLYWKHHLSHAQDTVLRESDGSASTHDKSPLGSRFKASYSTAVPESTLGALWQTKSSARISAAIVLAYAKTLGHFTGRSRPTFGLNHASRSLSSVDGAQTLDLTAASVPTLTVTPFCIDLDSSTQRSGSSSTSAEERLLDFVQDHLAQLGKFAQSDGLQRFCPRFNSYLNILNSEDDTPAVNDEGVKTSTKVVLGRYMLGEPLSSDYFTVTRPSSSTVSTIEELETGHLCPHQLFFNVIVRQGRDVSVAVSGDDALCGGGLAMATKLVSFFGFELAKIIDSPCAG